MIDDSTDVGRLLLAMHQALGSAAVALPPDAQMFLNAIMGSRPDFLLLTDARGHVEFMSAACQRHLGLSEDELQGLSFESLIAPKDRASLSQFMGPLVESRLGQSFAKLGPLDLRVLCKNPDTGAVIQRWMTLRVSAPDVLPRDGAANTLLFLSLTDITHHEAEEKRILQQLNFDALTGLPSRYNLLSQIEQHIALNQTAGVDTPFHLAFFDTDRFKNVNDALGHRLGDRFLSALCHRLQNALDEGQIFGRFGGDEFLLFFPGVADLGEASKICMGALDTLLEPLQVDGYTLSCGASFGIARYPDHGSTVDELIQAADTAMYHIKSQGIGGCAVFDSSMNAERFSQLELEQELRAALVQGDFVAFYQPLVCLRSGQIKGVEALARWNHKRLGLLEPKDFLSLALQAGLMQEIDLLVQRQALRDAGHWLEQGFDVHLSINCSAVQVELPDFVTQIENLCAEMQFPANRLYIELTEQTLVRQIEHAVNNIQAVRDRGMKIAIDDFGMGYSSLKYLREFPIDILKIDRSFIQDLHTDQDVEAGVSLVDAIIAMAKGLGLTLIAEGVERPAQLAYLQGKSCDQAQGYLFTQACSSEQMLKVLSGSGFAAVVGAEDSAG